MIHLARDGINAYRNWNAYTGLVNTRARFEQDGVLWMPGTDKLWADGEHARMQHFGIPTEVLDDVDVKERFPALNACTMSPDLETGEPHSCVTGSRNLLELEAGHVDPVSAAQDLVEACRNRGVEIRFRSRVVDIESQGGKVRGVVLEDGGVISTPTVINAAGPWCNQLSAVAGLTSKWNMQPTRIQVLCLDRPEEVKGHIPVTVDMQDGIYFRTQNGGQQLIVGSVLEEDDNEKVADPDCFDLAPDDVFIRQKLHVLHHRLMDLPYRGKVRGYCGLYTINRIDVHPVVGPTELGGYWVANGFSGHGFKLAPAIGSMVAQAITGELGGFDTSVPASFLAVDRDPIEVGLKSVLA
jgi:glycine/D-amino acid oxidase-like deaminating enzyme